MEKKDLHIDRDNVEVDEKDHTPDRHINGEPIYYTTSQVAERLNENPSTIRYWCDEFEPYLKIRKSGRNRMYTKLDIKKLEYIRELLKVQNLTIRQVKEYLSTPEAMVMQPVSLEKDHVFLAALGKIVSNELDRRFAMMQENLMDYMEKKFTYMSSLETFIRINQKEILFEIKEQMRSEFEKQGKKQNEKMAELDRIILEREERLNNYIAEKFRQKEVENEKPKQGLFAMFARLFGK
jgi:DNA-binding transcriptional MerR regulator